MRFAGSMNVRSFRLGFAAFFMVGASGAFSAKGELPPLDDRKWVGCFVALESKQYEFSVTTQGKGKIEVLGKKGTPVGNTLAVSIDFVVQEVLPDGKIVNKAIKTESLESAQAATLKPRNIVICGKVTGDAAFEAYLTEERGAISVGGKLTDPGTLTKYPLRFSIRVNFPDAYVNDKSKSGDKKEVKSYEQKIEKDRLHLKWADGKSRKQDLAEAVDASSPEINGQGITALSLEISSYQEKKFVLLASENSLMTLSNASAKPMNTGFAANWVADPAKDPQSKARLTIDVK